MASYSTTFTDTLDSGTSIGAAVTANAGSWYLLILSSKGGKSVTSVTDDNQTLTWNAIGDQCSGRHQTHIFAYEAFDDGTGTDFTVTAAVDDGSWNIHVHEYTGVNTTTPYRNFTSSNSNGVADTGCSGGSDGDPDSITLTIDASDSIAFSAIETRNDDVTADSQFTERSETQANTGGSASRLTCLDDATPATPTQAIDHSSSSTDWCQLALEIVNEAAGGGYTPRHALLGVG